MIILSQFLFPIQSKHRVRNISNLIDRGINQFSYKNHAHLIPERVEARARPRRRMEHSPFFLPLFCLLFPGEREPTYSKPLQQPAVFLVWFSHLLYFARRASSAYSCLSSADPSLVVLSRSSSADLSPLSLTFCRGSDDFLTYSCSSAALQRNIYIYISSGALATSPREIINNSKKEARDEQLRIKIIVLIPRRPKGTKSERRAELGRNASCRAKKKKSTDCRDGEKKRYSKINEVIRLYTSASLPGKNNGQARIRDPSEPVAMPLCLIRSPRTCCHIDCCLCAAGRRLPAGSTKEKRRARCSGSRPG